MPKSVLPFAENFIFESKTGLNSSNISYALKEVRNLTVSLNGGKGFKAKESNSFLVHIQGMIGNLPKANDVLATSGKNFDLLSAFQTFFVFQGEIFALTTYSCPLNKYSNNLMNEIDCFLVLGNENLFMSRRDCEDALDLIQREKLENVVMVVNSSQVADQDAWPGQMEKEEQLKDKHVGSVTKLQQYIEGKQQEVLKIDTFSHHNVSLIFNHILKKCVIKRKVKGRRFDIQEDVPIEGGTAINSNTPKPPPEKSQKKCEIF